MKDINSIISHIQQKKGHLPIAEMTAYDYPSARLIDEAQYDIILVGDSLGMVIMGYPDTTQVTLDHMIHHVSIVARGAKKALVVGDMPIDTYITPEQAVASAQALIDAGADAVKLEGGAAQAEKIKAIVEAGIPVQGHIGLLPQNIKKDGGYHIKGKTDEEAAALMTDMHALVQAGVFSIVIECTRPHVTAAITEACPIPTIGIGSGHGTCDGEVCVYHDLIGAFPWFIPSFVKPKAHISEHISNALMSWKAELTHPQNEEQ